MCMNLEQKIMYRFVHNLHYIYSCIENMHMYLHSTEREAICNELQAWITEHR